MFLLGLALTTHFKLKSLLLDDHLIFRFWFAEGSGPWFNIKMTSYEYRKSHCGDKTILRSCYLHKFPILLRRNLYIESGSCWQPIRIHVGKLLVLTATLTDNVDDVIPSTPSLFLYYNGFFILTTSSYQLGPFLLTWLNWDRAQIINHTYSFNFDVITPACFTFNDDLIKRPFS